MKSYSENTSGNIIFTKLNFELTKYKSDEEDDIIQRIRFDGHRGWQNIQFFNEPPSERQLKLLVELSRILSELSEEIEVISKEILG